MLGANAVLELFMVVSKCTEENRKLTSLGEIQTYWTHVITILSTDGFYEGDVGSCRLNELFTVKRRCQI